MTCPAAGRRGGTSGPAPGPRRGPRRPTSSPARRAWGLAAAGLALAAPVAAPAAAPAPPGFADLVAGLLPAVVNISAVTEPPAGRAPPGPDGRHRRPFERRHGPAGSLGSGFIVKGSGYIATNNHVVAGADRISVTLQDETRLDAVVVGRDVKTDLALLKVDAGGAGLPAVGFGDSSTLRVGDWVLAIGNPFGLGGTVTLGIVSARHRDINAGPYDDFLQTDASINQGNSGGPMFNARGEVVGINTAILAPQGHSVGVGFAIPSNLALPILEQLERFGRVRRGWLGVQFQDVTDEIAGAMGLPGPAGALVTAVAEGGPAERHGIEAGDVILRFGGEDVGGMRRLPRLVAEAPSGESVVVEVWRDGGLRRLGVVLGAFPGDGGRDGGGGPPGAPEAAPAELAVGRLGIRVSRLTPELRRRFGLGADERGVVVVDVERGGPAARGAIEPGTMIRRIGPEHRVVEDPSQVADAAREADGADRPTVLLFVETRGVHRFVALEIDRG